MRLSEVSSAADVPRPPAPGFLAGHPSESFRVDETGAGEYSPPTLPIVAHPDPDRHTGRREVTGFATQTTQGRHYRYVIFGQPCFYLGSGSRSGPHQRFWGLGSHHGVIIMGRW
ncbi:hypothetical protein L3i22_017890 [Actinoplanes sp. L3-i22]|nr:hypothetical protein L3i22_017890 [Actinoplanes sp. L3-i22]